MAAGRGDTERPVDATEQVVVALLAASRAMVAVTARSIARLDANLTLPQYRMLVVLASRTQRAVDLAEELDITPSTVSRACDRLVRRGLVQRFHRPDDRRATWAALTDDGKEQIGAVMRQRRAEVLRLIAGTSIGAPQVVAAALDSFVQAAGELPEQEWWQRWEASSDFDGQATL
jgi:DNA-binding MarR family transcriptional regulator